MRLPAVSAARGLLPGVRLLRREGSARAEGPPPCLPPRALSLPQGPPPCAGHGPRPSAGGHGCAAPQPGAGTDRSSRTAPATPGLGQRLTRPSHTGPPRARATQPRTGTSVCVHSPRQLARSPGAFIAGPWRGHKRVRSLLQETWICEGPERLRAGTRVLGLRAAPALPGEGQGVCKGECRPARRYRGASRRRDEVLVS